ncbi:uncharacterized protein Pyn_18573 [Prunus yedoensis var. nudiflora]|uniref:O-fucosyltransferase family protein n=1 Tax=Prunus yedoensis var. nudiflora TaxID=2094558 RepID=A0A314YPH7_PRUYE|nr:uncharacterized protein Pyn_18573 [Prunus yedoensis var. nudiflora]
MVKGVVRRGKKILAHTLLPTTDTLRHLHSSLRNDGVSQLILMVPYLNSGPSPSPFSSSSSSSFFFFFHLRQCCNAADNFATADVKAYLLTATSGGLNQQRRGVSFLIELELHINPVESHLSFLPFEINDAVVAAYILNATLVVPKLDQKSLWKDSSKFDEIFDVDWFISSLSKDVEIIKQLPTKGGKPMSPYTMHVPRKCNAKCY